MVLVANIKRWWKSYTHAPRSRTWALKQKVSGGEERDRRYERRLKELALALLLLLGEQHCLDRLVKHSLEVVTVLSRALEVADGLDLLGESVALLGGDGRLTACLELVDGSSVRAKIDLGADQDLRNIGAEVDHLGVPLDRWIRADRPGKSDSHLGLNVLVGGRVHDREADEEDVGVGVRERAETVVL